MRLIKFRAWDKRKQEMSQGELSFRYENEYGIMNVYTDGVREIEEFELMQFTGLLDKNGKEIYESDIVRCFDTDGDMVYDHIVDFFEFRKEIWSEEHEGRTKVEIIGNIYEKPELLPDIKG